MNKSPIEVLEEIEEEWERGLMSRFLKLAVVAGGTLLANMVIEKTYDKVRDRRADNEQGIIEAQVTED